MSFVRPRMSFMRPHSHWDKDGKVDEWGGCPHGNSSMLLYINRGLMHVLIEELGRIFVQIQRHNPRGGVHDKGCSLSASVKWG